MARSLVGGGLRRKAHGNRHHRLAEQRKAGELTFGYYLPNGHAEDLDETVNLVEKTGSRMATSKIAVSQAMRGVVATCFRWSEEPALSDLKIRTVSVRVRLGALCLASRRAIFDMPIVVDPDNDSDLRQRLIRLLDKYPVHLVATMVRRAQPGDSANVVVRHSFS